MKMKVDNFLGLASSDNYDRLVIRLNERFGGSFTLEPFDEEDTFDLIWTAENSTAQFDLISTVRAYVEGYLSH